MILDVAFVAVFAGVLVALWANYRLELQIAQLLDASRSRTAFPQQPADK